MNNQIDIYSFLLGVLLGAFLVTVAFISPLTRNDIEELEDTTHDDQHPGY